MFARVLVAIVVLIVAAASVGCSREASYPVALLATDDGLVGEWISKTKSDDDTVHITITQRTVSVRNGRTEGSRDVVGGGEPGKPVTAYTVLMTREREVGSLELSAVLIELNGTRLLGIQASDEELRRNPLGAVVLPLHFLLRIEREGDTMKAWAPGRGFAWVPRAQWIDPPCESPPGVARDEARGLRLTSSIDRLLDEYRAEMVKPGFWSEDSVTLTREP